MPQKAQKTQKGIARKRCVIAWRGRNTGRTQGTCAATYSYLYGDKLKSATSSFPGESASVVYNYDGLGKRRYEAPAGTTPTWFRWSGWEESGEYAAGTGGQVIGAKQTGYVPGLAAYAGADPSTADWRFNLNDHLGSPRQMLGQDKSAKARQDFSPYGELMRSAGLPLTVGYTGHRWDPAIGQYFAPFRYYNPQTARWNMRDPLGYAAGLNVYLYVGGNPVAFVDALGLQDTYGSCHGNIDDYGQVQFPDPPQAPDPTPPQTDPVPPQPDPIPVPEPPTTGGTTKPKPTPPIIERKVPRPGSGKERASNPPSWIDEHGPDKVPRKGQNGKGYAGERMRCQYGDCWQDVKGQTRINRQGEYNQLKKYCDRAWQDPE